MKCLCLLLSFFLVKISLAQDIRFKRLTIEDGLPENSVNCIYQDSEGFMWFGLKDGLCRYDGYTFKNFVPSPDSSGMLPSGLINAIREDPAGNIWAGTRNHLVKFNKITEAFETIAAMEVNHILLSSDSTLWISSKDAAYRLPHPYRKTDMVKHSYPSLPPTALDYFISSGTEDRNGDILFSTYKHIYRFDKRAGSLQIVQTGKPASRVYFSNIISGKRWVWATGPWPGVSAYQTEKGLLFTLRLNDKSEFRNVIHPNSLVEDRKGNLWAGSYNGLWYIKNPGKDAIINVLTPRPNDAESLSDEFVQCIYEDRAGFIWVGTTGGISIYNPEGEPFKFFPVGTDSVNTVNRELIWSLSADRNKTLWIAADKGLYKLPCSESTGAGISCYSEALNTRLLPDDHIFSLSAGKENSLWLTVRHKGLIRLNTLTGKMHRFSEPEILAGATTLWHVMEDSRGRVWICSIKGLVMLNEKEELNVFPADPKDPRALPGYSVICAYEDSRGSIWLGTESGVARYIENTGDFRFYKLRKKNENESILTFCDDGAGRVWAGYEGDGLCLIDPEKGIIEQLTTNEGLSHNRVNGIMRDMKNNLWISTDNGLSLYNTHTKKFRNFDKADGLPFVEFQQKTFARGPGGIMFFGGLNGVIGFDPQSFSSPMAESELVISDLRINYSTLKDPERITSPLAGISQLDLFDQDKSVSFEFSALNYAKPGKVFYAYRLDGFDNTWNYTDHRKRIATYTSLPAGEYFLRIKATNGSGDWQKNERVIRLTVHPPFWKTMWFISLCIFALASALFFSIRSYTARKYKLRMREQEIEQNARLSAIIETEEKERKRIAGELHDGLGQLLSAARLNVAGLEESTGEEDLPLVKNSMSLLDEACDEVRNISHNMMPSALIRLGLIPTLRELSGKINSSGKIKVMFTCNMEERLREQVEINLYRIIQEILNNMLRHSDAAKIGLDLTREKEGYVITINDDGKGFDTSLLEKSTGLGWKNIHSRLQMISGKMRVDSAPGKGTNITITLKA